MKQNAFRVRMKSGCFPGYVIKMNIPVMRTCLYIPRAGDSLLDRPGLNARLDKSLKRKLTIVSAPAGFGKTSLISSWAARQGIRCCWLSLNENINEPLQFLRYFISALQTVVPEICSSVLSAIESPKPPDPDHVFPYVLDELGMLPELIFVMDDYHLMTDPGIDGLTVQLIEAMPRGLRLIISTRTDPLFPLSLLRGRRELNEIRAEHLRFSREETFSLLNGLNRQELSSEDSAILCERTEGWVTGLHMALLSIEDREDKSGFIRKFSSGNSYVLDYLVDQVLDVQTDRMRDFLLQTSLLQQLSGGLCSAVTGWPDSDDLLKQAVRKNLFIQPLDDCGEWYRYHHLFRELLLSRLEYSDPERIRKLHEKASSWLKEHGYLSGAIDHALKAGDTDSVMSMLSGYVEGIWSRGEQQKLSVWLEQIPEVKLYGYPDVLAQYALTLSFAGRFAEAEKIAGMIETGGGGNEALMPLISAFSDIFTGRIKEAREKISRAAEGLAPDDHLRHTVAGSLNGDICVYEGNMRKCESLWLNALEHSLEAGNRFLSHWAGAKLIVARKRLGRLKEAEQTFHMLRERNRFCPEASVSGACYSVTGDVCLEWLDTDRAVELIEKGLYYSQRQDYSGGIAWSYASLTHARAVLRDYEGMASEIARLEQAEASGRLPGWISCWINALKVRLYLKTGYIKAAGELLAERNVTIGSGFSYPREIEYLELARVLLQTDPEAAGKVICSLKQRFSSTGWTDRLYEAELLGILQQDLAGNTDAAEDGLRNLISETAAEGYTRLYVIEGDAAGRLLHRVMGRHGSDGEAGRLFSALCSLDGRRVRDCELLNGSLSSRELAVLELIAAGRSNKETAEQLYISTGTVKNHLKSIYRKLDVSSRTQAAARGRAAGLIK